MAGDRGTVDVDAVDALRFLLELASLGAVGYWGRTTHAGASRWAWALGAPLALGAAWATFRVENDPGPAPVAVPGPARLALELLSFAAAALALAAADRPPAGGALAALVVIHYALDRHRVRRLLTRT